jgi:hypothetical protein
MKSIRHGFAREVWIADADGERARRLTAGYDAKVSRNGQWVAFARGRRPDLYVIGTDGRDERRIARWAYPAAWAPDSRRIVAVRDRTLLIVTRDASESPRVLARRELASDVALSPDGRRIAYVSSAGRAPCGDLVTVSLEGSTRRRLTRRLDLAFPVWAEDEILVTRLGRRCLSLNGGIWSVAAHGGGVRPLLRNAPARLTRLGYAGVMPFARLDNRRVLIGIRSEWGNETAVLHVETKKIRRLSGGHFQALSRDRRLVLEIAGSAEFPFAVLITPVAGGRPRRIAYGPFFDAHWNG